MIISKNKSFIISKMTNDKLIIDFEFCEKLLLSYYSEINKILDNENINELYINLPAISESSFEETKTILTDLHKKYGERCLFCVNDYGIYYFLEQNNIKFLIGRILLRMFLYISNNPIDIFKNLEGGVISKGQKIGFLEGKNNIEIGYNNLISISLECKHKRCNYDCIGGEIINGMNKKMFLCGKNLYYNK